MTDTPYLSRLFRTPELRDPMRPHLFEDADEQARAHGVLITLAFELDSVARATKVDGLVVTITLDSIASETGCYVGQVRKALLQLMRAGLIDVNPDDVELGKPDDDLEVEVTVFDLQQPLPLVDGAS